MIFLYLLSRLPLWFLYQLSNLIYFIAFYVVGYRKKVVLENLEKAFPEKNRKELLAIRKKFYRRLTDYILETVKALTISADKLSKRVKFTNIEILDKYDQSKQSIVVLASHSFNWEWGLLVGCIIFPFPVDAMYQKLSNKKFDQLMFNLRSRFGGKPVEKDNAYREIIRNKERHMAVAIVADQSPTPDAVKYWTTFLNQPTAFYVGSQQIARLGNYPVLYMSINSPKRGYYEVELVHLCDPPYEKGSFGVLEKFVEIAQNSIKNDPSGWLWSHRRWKLKPDKSKEAQKESGRSGNHEL